MNEIATYSVCHDYAGALGEQNWSSYSKIISSGISTSSLGSGDMSGLIWAFLWSSTISSMDLVGAYVFIT